MNTVSELAYGYTQFYDVVITREDGTVQQFTALTGNRVIELVSLIINIEDPQSQFSITPVKPPPTQIH